MVLSHAHFTVRLDFQGENMLRGLLLCSLLVFAASATVAVAEVELPADV